MASFTLFYHLIFWSLYILHAWSRSTLIWMWRHDNNTEAWNEMVNEVNAHKVNITYISMCSYRLLSDGTFGYQSSSTAPTGLIMEEWTIKLQSLGIKQLPLIDCSSTNAAELMLGSDTKQQAFIL